jgi:hypothetical protein
MAAKLSSGRRLALAVEADQHDALAHQADLARLAKQPDQFVVNDFDDVLARRHPGFGRGLKRLAFDLLGNLPDEPDIDIGPDEGHFNVVDDFADEGRIDFGGACDLSQGPFEGGGERVEYHGESTPGGSALKRRLR